MNKINGLKFGRSDKGVVITDATLDTDNIVSSIRMELNINNSFDIPFVSKALARMNIDVIIDDEGALKGYKRPTAIIVHEGQILNMLYGDILFYGVDGMGDTVELTEQQMAYILNNFIIGELFEKDTEDTFQVAVIPYQ